MLFQEEKYIELLKTDKRVCVGPFYIYEPIPKKVRQSIKSISVVECKSPSRLCNYSC